MPPATRGRAVALVGLVGAACGDLSPSLVVGTLRPDAQLILPMTEARDAGFVDREPLEAPSDLGFVRPPSVDLTLLRADGAPEALHPGSPFQLVVVFENDGTDPSPASLARVELLPSGALLGQPPVTAGEVEFAGLPSGEIRDLPIDATVPPEIPQGRYRVRVALDPDDEIPEDNERNNDLEAGVVDIGTLRVFPRPVDFGEVGPSCYAAQSLFIENTGPEEAILDQVRLDPFGATAFSLAPVHLPLRVAVGSTVGVDLAFVPSAVGRAFSRLQIGQAGFAGVQEVWVLGVGRTHPGREDDFFPPRRKLDVLFVVQDGCARRGCEIEREQQGLAGEFRDFRRTAGSLIDYRVLVTTTDPDGHGLLRGPIITSQMSEASAVDAFLRQVVAGASGSPHPAGLAAAHAVVANGLIREDAGLLVVVLAIDDDRSEGSPLAWVDALRTAAGARGASRVRISGIVAPPPSGCRGDLPLEAEPAERYHAAIVETGGTLSDICGSSDYRALYSLTAGGLGLAWRYPLSQKPIDPDTFGIEVEVDGVVVPAFDQVAGEARWRYDPSSAAVEFEPGHEPEPGARIVIRYRSAC